MKSLCAKHFGRSLLVIGLPAFLFLAVWHADATARTYMCSSNPDYFSKRCTVHPYAVTQRVDGADIKGHLVGCQFKSWTCMQSVCRDNYGTAQIPFFFPMDDIKQFCYHLCNNPSCVPCLSLHLAGVPQYWDICFRSPSI